MATPEAPPQRSRGSQVLARKMHTALHAPFAQGAAVARSMPQHLPHLDNICSLIYSQRTHSPYDLGDGT